MKFMNMKRFGAVAMAGALALSLAAPAFAANTTVIEGTYTEIPIAVLVPETGTAQINPYGLPVAVYKSDETPVNIVGEKITNVPLSIRNQGTVALDVGATLAVLPRGGLSIKGGALANTDKGKQANVTLEIASLNDAAYAVDSGDAGLEDALIDAFVADSTWSGLVAANKLVADATAANATTAGTATSGTTPLASLGAASVNVATEAVTYGPKSIALFRLAGELNAEPEKTESGNQVADPWTEEDGFTATVVFKFTPATPGDATLAASITGTAATATFTVGTSGLTVDSYTWTSSDTDVATVPTTTTTGAATITQVGGATAGDTATITVVANLSNGSTLTATATFTAT